MDKGITHNMFLPIFLTFFSLIDNLISLHLYLHLSLTLTLSDKYPIPDYLLISLTLTTWPRLWFWPWAHLDLDHLQTYILSLLSWPSLSLNDHFNLTLTLIFILSLIQSCPSLFSTFISTPTENLNFNLNLNVNLTWHCSWSLSFQFSSLSLTIILALSMNNNFTLASILIITLTFNFTLTLILYKSCPYLLSWSFLLLPVTIEAGDRWTPGWRVGVCSPWTDSPRWR